MFTWSGTAKKAGTEQAGRPDWLGTLPGREIPARWLPGTAYPSREATCVTLVDQHCHGAANGHLDTEIVSLQGRRFWFAAVSGTRSRLQVSPDRGLPSTMATGKGCHMLHAYGVN